VGLAASQARLLSLTNRQHTVENEAQRLQNFKMRLSNDSDKAYQVYLNALNETSLKTLQTSNETGDSTWIRGSINNLMRYGTSDNTTGSVFYVQDLETGKLYVPDAVGQKYDAATDARNFAEQFGITYTVKDLNEDVKINYQKALDKGWDTIMNESTLDAYYQAKAKDTNIKTMAAMVLNTIPSKDNKGLYQVESYQPEMASNFVNQVTTLMGSTYYTTSYTASERSIIESALNLIQTVDDGVTAYNPSDHGTVSTDGTKLTLSTGDVWNLEQTENEVTLTQDVISTITQTKNYSISKISAKNSSGNEYISEATDSYDLNNRYELMLNGGTAEWEVTEYEAETYTSNKKLISENSTTSNKTKNIYDSATTSKLSAAGYSNYGEALSKIFEKVCNDTKYVDNFLSTHGLSEESVQNYLEYINLKGEYDAYAPEYEYTPSDTVKGPYYEEVYNAIKAAGGWIGASDGRANNDTWVSNMIKNAQVILTTWDSENEMLSKTAASLNTNIKEVTDNSRIEQASQDYEAEMDKINNKDTTYDTKLSSLETERSSLQTEIDALQNVIKNNVEKHFKIVS